MHLSTLASAGLASILFNALPSHGQQVQLLRGGKLPIPELPSTENLSKLGYSPLAHDGKVEHCFSWHDSEACRGGGRAGYCGHDWTEKCIMCKMDEKADKLTGECVRSGGDDDDDTPASPLVGTEWQVTEFNGAPALLSHELSFETETVVSGNDGCNPFNGMWGTLPTNDGNDIDTRIMIDVFSTGGRMCSFTAEAAGQRTFLHNVLFQEATPYFLSADEQELILYLELKQEGSRPLPMVLSRIKNSIPDNEDTPIALGGGKSLIGMNGEEAKAAIEAIDPLLSVHIVPEGSMVTMDLRDDRVRIFVDKDENVAREPQIG